MPRAEVGSSKHLSNKMKSKGLQRLRWYCQACEKQCRDENGFKCHTQSESHVRNINVIGSNAQKYIQDYSNQFLRTFIQQLRTAHGEKSVNINHFYQEVIANKEHIHMNATRWHSLTDFAKYLGQEGLCRVEEGEKGIQISWIDNSPEALRRQDAIRKKERQDRGDEEREQRLIEEQVRRAQADAQVREDDEPNSSLGTLQDRAEGEKVKLRFGKTTNEVHAYPTPLKTNAATDNISSKPKNVFAAASKKKTGSGVTSQAPKKMSEAERIMKEEIERKRRRENASGLESKRQRLVSA